MKISEITSVKLTDGTEVFFDNKYYTVPAYQELMAKYKVKVSKTWLTKLANEREIITLPIVEPETNLRKTYIIINNSDTFLRVAKTGDYIGFHGGAENANKQGSKIGEKKDEKPKQE